MPKQSSIPIELLEQLERGNVLLFVGEVIHQGILPSSTRLAQELAERCAYPAEEPLTLPRVAGYYEMTRNDRHGLVQFLRDRLETPNMALPRAHDLAVRLRLPVIVTTCYDRFLERALRDANISYVPVVGNAEVAYDDRDKVLLVWLWGVLDQPDSLVITEDDRRLFLETRANLSDILRGEMARRTWLFLGFNAEDAWFRDFYDNVNRGLDRQSRRSYIFGMPPGAYTRTWWQKRNAEILSVDIEMFLTELTEQLAARAQTKTVTSPISTPADLRPLPGEPYKALVAYEAQDRALFFGRKEEIEELTALIHAHRLVLLYGASGVGKTSLLQAGVIPRLEDADPGYTVINVRALIDPADAIRADLHRRLPDAELPAADMPLVDCLAAAVCTIDRPLIVIIDQFEEFFIRLSPEFRAAFIDDLGRLCDARDLRVKVVLSLREDYLARVSEIEERIPEIFQTKLRLLPLNREQARAAVVHPVETLGYTYAPALVERLLDDLTREGVMPPQLQLVCGALFHHGRKIGQRTLTLDLYKELGGAQGVLRGYLDQELRRFPPEEQTLARDLLEELVTSERTKKVETIAELATSLAVQPAKLNRIIEKLVRARLLHPVERTGKSTRMPAYELAHEYLIAEIALNPDVIARKEAEEIINQELDNYRRFGISLSLEKLLLINDVREDLRLNTDAQELILRGAIKHEVDIMYWLKRMEDPERRESVLRETVSSQSVQLRRQVVTILETLGDANSLEMLIELAVSDPHDEVRSAAQSSLRSLNKEKHKITVPQLVAIAAGPNSTKAKRALESLSYLPLQDLSPGLRAKALVTRLQLEIKKTTHWVLATSARRSLAFTIGLLTLLIVVGYVFSSSYHYLSAEEQLANGERRVVVRRGHPDVPLPGADVMVIDTGLKLSYFTEHGMENVWDKRLRSFRWRKKTASAPQWEQHALNNLGPHPSNQMYWYLGNRHNSIEQILGWLDSDIYEYASEALIDILAVHPELSSQQAISQTQSLLDSPNPSMRISGVKAMAQIGISDPALAPQAVTLLSSLTTDKQSSVRYETTAALNRILEYNPAMSPHVIDELEVLLSDSDLQTRFSAAEASVQLVSDQPEMATSQMSAVLLTLITDEDWDISYQAKIALEEMLSVDAKVAIHLVKPLNELLSHEDEGVRNRAVGLLSRALVQNPEVATPNLIEALTSLVSDESPDVQIAARTTIEQLIIAHPTFASQVADTLSQLLAHEREAVRHRTMNAVDPLLNASPELATPQLIQALSGLLTDEYLYTTATNALKRIVAISPETSSQVAENLIDLLVDENWYVRLSATSVLEQIVTVNPDVMTPHLIQALTELLIDNDSDVQGVARNTLEQLLMVNSGASSQVAEILGKYLIDANASFNVRCSALYALGQLVDTSAELATPQVAGALSRLISDESNLVRSEAAVALKEAITANPEIVTSEMIKSLVNTLTDESPGIRFTAINALNLALNAKPEATTLTMIEAISGLLTEEDANVREAATNALEYLVTIDEETAVEVKNVLRGMLADERWYVRQSAVKVLDQAVTTNPEMVTDREIQLLTKLLVDADPGVRETAKNGIKQLLTDRPDTPAQVADLLNSMLTEDPPNVRYQATNALAQILNAHPEVATDPLSETLEDLLTDENNTTRLEAVNALAQIMTSDSEAFVPQITTTLMELLAADDSYVRYYAFDALQQIISVKPQVVDHEMTALLIELLADEEIYIRSSAAETLELMVSADANTRSPKVAEALVDSLTDEEDYVRSQAASALQHIASTDPLTFTPQTVDSLFNLLDDEDMILPQEAAYVLGQIAAADSALTTRFIESIAESMVTGEASNQEYYAFEALQVGISQKQFSAIDELMELLDHTDWQIRLVAAVLLLLDEDGNVNHSLDKQTAIHASNSVLGLLNENDERARNLALEIGQGFITELPEMTPYVFESLIETIKIGGSEAKAGAARFLGEIAAITPTIATSQTVESLSLLTTDEKAMVRKAATEALGEIFTAAPVLATPSLTEDIIVLFHDDDNDVSAQASTTLVQIVEANAETATPKMVRNLVELLFNDENGVQANGGSTLEQIMKTDPKTAPWTVMEIRDQIAEEDSIRSTHVINALNQATAIHPELAYQTVDMLIPILTEQGSETTADAIETLEQIVSNNPSLATPQLAKALMELLMAEDWAVRFHALEALEQVLRVNSNLTTPKMVQFLLEMLTDEDSDVRASAVNALGLTATVRPEVTTAKVMESLVRMLADNDGTVRSNTAETLSALANSPRIYEIVEGLTGLLSDENSDVRLEAVTTLKQIAIANPDLSPYVYGHLIEILNDDTWAIRSEAANGLGDMISTSPALVTPQATETLVNLLDSEDSGVRLWSTYLLEQMVNVAEETATPEVAKQLVRRLQDEEESIRARAAYALRDMLAANPVLPTEEITGILMEQLHDASWQARSGATDALGHVAVTNPEAAQEITAVVSELLNDENAQVRYNAASALGTIGSVNADMTDRTVISLTESLTDWDSSVRAEAVQSLGSIGAANSHNSSQIIETLIDQLSDEGSYVRPSVTSALKGIVADNPDVAWEAIEKLTPLLAEESSTLLLDVDLRVSVVWTLGDIGVANPKTAPTVMRTLTQAFVEEQGLTDISAIHVLGQLAAVSPEIAPQVVETLAESLTNNSEQVQTSAAEALGQIIIGNPQAVDQVAETLINLLDEENIGYLRLTHELSNTIANNPEVALDMTEILLDFTAHEDWRIRFIATELLRQAMKADAEAVSSEMEEAILKRLTDEKESVRSRARLAFEQIVAITPNAATPEVVEVLLGSLVDEDDRACAEIIWALGQIISANPELIDDHMAEVLKEMLGDDEGYIRFAAVNVLGSMLVDSPELIDRQMITRIADLLNYENTGERVAAIYALAKAGSVDLEKAPQVIKYLIPLLNDESEGVRSEAADSLMLIYVAQAEEPAVADQVLESLVNPKNSQIRSIAREALFTVALQHPSHKKPIREGLVQLSESRQPYERMTANRALEMLRIADLAQTAILRKGTQENAIRALEDFRKTSFFGEEFSWSAGEALRWVQQQSMGEERVYRCR
jgi:HEAT repeat protein